MSIAKDDYRATISVLRKNPKNFVVDRITVTFKELLNCEYTYDKYDFRLSKFENIDVTRRLKGIHFNTIVSAPGGLELSEGLYLSSFFAYQLKEYYKGHLRRPSFYGLINQYIRYEYKMQKCKKNDPVNFNKSIQNIALDHHLIEIHDLKEIDQVSGLYLLILDNYNLCYAGQSNNIKKRIQVHWRKYDYFSGTGIDMFRAKDTTRIFVQPQQQRNLIESGERSIIADLPRNYRLNSLAGGTEDYNIENNLSPFLPSRSITEIIEESENMQIDTFLQKNRYVII